MDEFAREWTYRTPMITKTYPKGHTEALPAEVRKAAKADNALFAPQAKLKASKKPE